jgi:hypothetical protein
MKPFPVSSVRSASLARTALLAALLAVVSVLPAAAQEEEAPAQPARKLVQEIVEVRHADPEALAAVLRVFPTSVQAHTEMGLVTIRGTAEDVATAVAAARSLDVPPKPASSIEVTAHILGASKTSELAGDVPAHLEEVAGQLRQVFGYRGVELVDSVSVRVRDHGDAAVSGALSQEADREPSPYRLGFNRATVVSGQEARSIRLDGLLFEARLIRWRAATSDGEPGHFVNSEVNLTTDVEVREGQKAVVGKAATNGARDSLILVVEARVLD